MMHCAALRSYQSPAAELLHLLLYYYDKIMVMIWLFLSPPQFLFCQVSSDQSPGWPDVYQWSDCQLTGCNERLWDHPETYGPDSSRKNSCGNRGDKSRFNSGRPCFGLLVTSYLLYLIIRIPSIWYHWWRTHTEDKKNCITYETGKDRKSVV